MRAIVILLDSLNRHYLPCYGNDWVRAPNFRRLAERSVVFDNHWIGSMPCMPARRDLLTGRLGFLEKSWSGLEPFDITLPQCLHRAGVRTHMETDHYHYFVGGGEGYHTGFSTWNIHRGQEWDQWAVDLAEPPEPPHRGKWRSQTELNRRRMPTDADYPTPRTFAGGVEFLRTNREYDDWLLWIEGFDPHEPFHAPEEFQALYPDDYTGPEYDWSGYERVDPEDPAVGRLRRRYAATLSMTDAWLGRLLDELEAQDRFEDTLVILTTDHGHLLGEHGATGKNNWHCWREIANIPLLVHLPGSACAGERRDRLTQNLDLMPTLLHHFGAEGPSDRLQGTDLLPVAADNANNGRRTALFGYHGQDAGLTDGRYTYYRAPADRDNRPLYLYGLMPSRFHGLYDPEIFNRAEWGPFLPWTGTCCWRVPHDAPLAEDDERGDTALFDLAEDPEQLDDLTGTPAEEHMAGLLAEALRTHQSPPEQFERLGLV